MNESPSSQDLLQIRWINPSIRAIYGNDAQPLIQKTWSIALIRFDVRKTMTQDAMVRRTKAAKRQAVCRGAVKNEIRDAIRFEKLSKILLGLCSDLIPAVRDDMPWIKTPNRFKSFRTDSGIVVTCELAPGFDH